MVQNPFRLETHGKSDSGLLCWLYIVSQSESARVLRDANMVPIQADTRLLSSIPSTSSTFSGFWAPIISLTPKSIYIYICIYVYGYMYTFGPLVAQWYDVIWLIGASCLEDSPDPQAPSGLL